MDILLGKNLENYYIAIYWRLQGTRKELNGSDRKSFFQSHRTSDEKKMP